MPVEPRTLTSGCFRSIGDQVIGHVPTQHRMRSDVAERALLWGEGLCLVCLMVKPVGKPDAGNPHVRFDERGRETGPRSASTRALPRLYSCTAPRCPPPENT